MSKNGMQATGKGWDKGKRLFENLPELLRKHGREVMGRKEKVLFAAVKSAAAGSAPNRPLTLILKRATTPLTHTGSALRPTHFKLKEGGTKNNLHWSWGIPKGQRFRGMNRSGFKDLAALLTFLHGGPNLMRPKAYMKVKLSAKAQRLFALLNRATVRSARGGRGNRTRGRASLTGRAGELLRASKGQSIPALVTTKTKSRPFFRDAWNRCLPTMQKAVAEIWEKALKESVNG